MPESHIPRLNSHRGAARMELVSFSSRPGQYQQPPTTPIAQPQPTRATPGSAFRSLRSLLPFGPSKNGNGGQGSHSERKNSVSIDRKSSFTAERKPSTEFARKTSFSLDRKPQPSSIGRHSEDVVHIDRQQHAPERPSFSEPFDLSTIVEADVSRMPVRVEPDSPRFLPSPTDIDSEVRRALAPPSPTPSPLNPRADESLHSADIDAMDPDLRALLSPHKRKDIPRFESPPPPVQQPTLRRSEAKGRPLRPLPAMSPSAQSSPARKSQDGDRRDGTRRASTSRMPSSINRPTPTRAVTDAISRSSMELTSPSSRQPYSLTRPSVVRTRKRSESLSTDAFTPKTPSAQPPPRPSSALGPRTTRAFRAAGLIPDEPSPEHERDREREREQRPSSRVMRSVSALGVVHTRGLSHSSSWGRSASRTGMSADSPTFSVPASHAPSYSHSYSPSPASASTAPTSISTTFAPPAPADSQGSGNVAVDVLLRALADAQSTTQALRQENETLKRRLEDLEHTLAERDREQQQQQQQRHYTPSPSRDFTSSSVRDDSTLNSRARYHSSVETSIAARTRFTPSPSLFPSEPLARSRYSPSPALLGDDITNRSRFSSSPVSSARDRDRERAGARDSLNGHMPRSSLQLSVPITTRPSSTASMASSQFPTLPRDMSMLLHEEAEPARSSGSYSPQKLDLKPRLVPLNDLGPTPYPSPIKQPHPRRAHAHSKSTESATDFSFVESSPRSLFLRPEHDLLLRSNHDDDDEDDDGHSFDFSLDADK